MSNMDSQDDLNQLKDGENRQINLHFPGFTLTFPFSSFYQVSSYFRNSLKSDPLISNIKISDPMPKEKVVEQFDLAFLGKYVSKDFALLIGYPKFNDNEAQQYLVNDKEVEAILNDFKSNPTNYDKKNVKIIAKNLYKIQTSDLEGLSKECIIDIFNSPLYVLNEESLVSIVSSLIPLYNDKEVNYALVESIQPQYLSKESFETYSQLIANYCIPITNKLLQNIQNVGRSEIETPKRDHSRHVSTQDEILQDTLNQYLQNHPIVFKKDYLSNDLSTGVYNENNNKLIIMAPDKNGNYQDNFISWQHLSRSESVAYISEDRPGQFIIFKLVDLWVDIDAYMIKTYDGLSNPVSWKLEVQAPNKTDWIVIDEQTNSSALHEKRTMYLFPLKLIYRKAQIIKFTITSLNSNGNNILAIGSFDIYGKCYASVEKYDDLI